MKGLEAIKIIDDTFRYGHTDDEGYEVPPYKMCHVCDEEFEIAEKELKAFDIIKKKDVDIYIFKSCKTLNEYNSSIVHIVGETRELTQEEYDLLNEVLLEND